MTEQEAIKVIKNNFPKTCKMVDGRYKGGFDDTECDFGKALLLSISALEEIQQYRALGTVEELWEARKKQRAKKPIKMNVKWQYRCPCCNNRVTKLCPTEIEAMNSRELFCQSCGQAIDWSEEE